MAWIPVAEWTENAPNEKVPRLTKEELAAMISRCLSATRSGWIVALEGGGMTIGGPVCRMDENESMVVGTASDWGPTADPLADAKFIAHARQDMPRLIVELMTLRGMDAPDIAELLHGMQPLKTSTTAEEM